MSTDKMREEFEASYLRGDFYAAEKNSEVRFQDFRKHCAYVAFKTGWQASRAAIEVELPYDSDALNGDHDFIKGWRLGVKDTVLSIESLGLKVKL